MALPRNSLRLFASVLSRSLEPLSMRRHQASKLGTIFLFHRVSAEIDPSYPPLPPDEFDLHCQFFRDHFDVVPLAELWARFREGKSMAKLAAITFDDGYRDFLTVAYPLLRKHQLPSTHFLVSDCVRTGLPTWNLRLRHLISDRRERDVAVQHLSALPAAERTGWLEERERGRSPDFPAMIRPEDLSTVDHQLVSWQSHSASHALLTRCPEAELQRELSGSRKAISEWSGRAVTVLAYPNGVNNQCTRSAARAAGYEFAVAVDQTRVRPGADPFALPRLDVGALPRAMLASEVAGVHAALRGFL